MSNFLKVILKKRDNLLPLHMSDYEDITNLFENIEVINSSFMEIDRRGFEELKEDYEINLTLKDDRYSGSFSKILSTYLNQKIVSNRNNEVSLIIIDSSLHGKNEQIVIKEIYDIHSVKETKSSYSKSKNPLILNKHEFSLSYDKTSMNADNLQVTLRSNKKDYSYQDYDDFLSYIIRACDHMKKIDEVLDLSLTYFNENTKKDINLTKEDIFNINFGKIGLSNMVSYYDDSCKSIYHIHETDHLDKVENFINYETRDRYLGKVKFSIPILDSRNEEDILSKIENLLKTLDTEREGFISDLYYILRSEYNKELKQFFLDKIKDRGNENE